MEGNGKATCLLEEVDGEMRKESSLLNLDLSLSLCGDEQKQKQKQKQQDLAQLTILYRGAVNVFNVSPHMVKAIMMVANTESADQTRPNILNPKMLNLPITRKKSLQRFLEKRSDRVHRKPP